MTYKIVPTKGAISNFNDFALFLQSTFFGNSICFCIIEKNYGYLLPNFTV